MSGKCDGCNEKIWFKSNADELEVDYSNMPNNVIDEGKQVETLAFHPRCMSAYMRGLLFAAKNGVTMASLDEEFVDE